MYVLPDFIKNKTGFVVDSEEDPQKGKRWRKKDKGKEKEKEKADSDGDIHKTASSLFFFEYLL